MNTFKKKHNGKSAFFLRYLIYSFAKYYLFYYFFAVEHALKQTYTYLRIPSVFLLEHHNSYLLVLFKTVKDNLSINVKS